MYVTAQLTNTCHPGTHYFVHHVIYKTEIFKADLSFIIFLFYAFKCLVLVYLGPKTVPHTAFYVSLQCGAGDMAQWVKALVHQVACVWSPEPNPTHITTIN